jgi:hypothetical protein
MSDPEFTGGLEQDYEVTSSPTAEVIFLSSGSRELMRITEGGSVFILGREVCFDGEPVRCPELYACLLATPRPK